MRVEGLGVRDMTRLSSSEAAIEKGVTAFFEIEAPKAAAQREREFFIDNLLVRVHFIIEMIWWTGLAPWEF